MSSQATAIEARKVTLPEGIKSNPPPKRNPRWLGRNLAEQLLKYALVAIAAYGCYRFSSRFVLQAVEIDGSSMAPTLLNTDRYIVNRWVYQIREPRLSEIVVLRDPVDNSYLVKRIVAQQGDMIHMKGGKIFVNGKQLQESYLPRGTKTFGDPHYREQIWICGVNQYFVLGDNRNNSTDSRIYGAVSRQAILGMVKL